MQRRPLRFYQALLFSWLALLGTNALADGRFEAIGGLPQGCNGPINAMIETAQGDVVVAGFFTVCGGTAATGIARFDGKRWFNLGSGISGLVRALATIGTDVYAAGWFGRAGEVSAPGIARFDGVRWWPVGTGPAELGFNISGLVGYEGKLYVAGFFGQPGSFQSPQGFAVWDGTSWALPPPMPASGGGLVNDLSVHNGELFASTDNITLRLRGNTWSPLPGANQPGTLNGIVSDGSRLYGYRNVLTCSIICDSSVFQFDGSSWSNIGSFDRYITSVAVVNGEVYVSGTFRGLREGPEAAVLARRRNNTWEALPIAGLARLATIEPVIKLLAHRGTLLVAGSFTSIGEVSANRIAHFNGSSFSGLGNGVGNGLNSTVRAIAGLDRDIFVGGDFDQAGRTVTGGVAMQTQGQWRSLQKARSSVTALLIHQNQLFAAGSFDAIGSSTASSIARFDGGFWRALPPGTGISAGAHTLASIGLALYVGGNFAQAAVGSPNQLSSRGIARWQGNQWGIVGDGFAAGTDGTVRAIASLNGSIIVGGKFTTAGGLGDRISNIARFDGSRFHPLAAAPGSPPIGEVRALTSFRGQIYVAAVVAPTSSEAFVQLSRWDGTLLQPFGPQFRALAGFFNSPQINAMVVHADRLYVGGNFDQVGDTQASGVVAFDGSNWRPLGPPGARDVKGEVFALASAGDSLLIGGHFGLTGGQVSSNAVRYRPDLAGQSVSLGSSSSPTRE